MGDIVTYSKRFLAFVLGVLKTPEGAGLVLTAFPVLGPIGALILKYGATALSDVVGDLGEDFTHEQLVAALAAKGHKTELLDITHLFDPAAAVPAAGPQKVLP